MPIIRRTTRRRSTARLQARGRRPGRQQEAVDARRALCAAAGKADHPPHLRRGLERHRQLDRRAAVRVPQAHRRRHAREICLVPLRRGLFQHHRHGDGAASTDADDVQVRRRDSAAQLRLPDEVPHADQARLQESEVRHLACTSPTRTAAAIGRTRATTGSAGCKRALAVSHRHCGRARRQVARCAAGPSLPTPARPFSNPPAFNFPSARRRNGDPQSPSSSRRRHRPGSHGRGEAAHRLDERAQDGQVRDRGGAGRRLLLRRARGGDHRRHDGEGARRRCGDLRRGRRAEMGQGAVRCAPGGGPAAPAQGPRASTPTCARP